MNPLERYQSEDYLESIAIVGYACRFPGASNAEEFWQNLCEGVESVQFFSDEELNQDFVDPVERNDPNYVKAHASLNDVGMFDATVFGFTPREATLMDPQHRLFLECVKQGLEHAGYVPGQDHRVYGLFGGAGANTYLVHHLAPNGHLSDSSKSLQTFIHNKNDHFTTRVGYKLNFNGPCMSVQTACSTSLVAVSLACQALLNHQIDVGLGGGCTIMLPENTGYLYQRGGIGSPDGHCRAFDTKAAGTVGGSGAGVVVLKRLGDALSEGDPIHAIIRGTALNNDGNLKAGYTAPSVQRQAEVITMAQSLAEVSPDTISYIEAHGTGTPLGDPIEIEALTEAFRRETDRSQFCAIGSVKTNIGHLDTAAGIAGLLKTVLSLKHKKLPPSLHFESPNPSIDFENSPFYVNQSLQDWSSDGTPRRAGVSSFGIGGTNAHVILEEAPPERFSEIGRPHHLVCLSAKTASALETASKQMGEFLKQNPDVSIADVAYTLQVGRDAMEYRRMLVCTSSEEASINCLTLNPEQVVTRHQEATSRPLTFMFPGQGAQAVNMAREFYQTESVFREEVDRCAKILQAHLQLDLRQLLFPQDNEVAQANEKLKQTRITQPALFVIEYALARLWIAWGVYPNQYIGHSIGEYVAACLSGVFSLDDALFLVAMRGRLIGELSEGSMLAVPLSEEKLRPRLGTNLSLAAINGPSQCVISGPHEDIDHLETQLKEEGQITHRLHTSHAFHSHMMEPILEEFRSIVSRVPRHAPQTPLLSNVTGTWMTEEEALDPNYWARHIRHTVRFADGLNVLLENPDAVLLEVGPGRVLRTLCRWHPLKKPNQIMLSTLPHSSESSSEIAFCLNTIGQLWLVGVQPHWDRFYENEKRHRVPLPTYPFERQKYWVEPARSSPTQPSSDSLEKHPNCEDWFYQPTWKEIAALPLWDMEPKPVSFLIFSHEASPSETLIKTLKKHNHLVIAVCPGLHYERKSKHRFVINPQQISDYEALFLTLRQEGFLPQKVVHAWNLHTPTTPMVRMTSQLSADSFDLSLKSLLYLAQTMGKTELNASLDVVVLTTHASEVIGDDLLYPEASVISGPCLVIPQEYPNITCRRVDMDFPPEHGWRSLHWFEQLCQELLSASFAQSVAYRRGRRWERHYEAVRLPPVSKIPSLLRPRSVVMITGGLGGLGLEVARYLAAAVQACLVLVHRSEFPSPSKWESYLVHPEVPETIKHKIRCLQEIEQQGSELLMLQADVTQESEMRAVAEHTYKHFGGIHGVIHAAGAPGGGVIQRKTWNEVETVLAPKIKGAQVLANVFSDDDHYPLDFFILFSSLTTIVPRLGQIDYTAANAFLDAFAQVYANKTQTFTTSINWGAWDEVGMAAQAKVSSMAQSFEEVGHPLLERKYTEHEGEILYATDFNVDRHWVLDEHRIFGNPIIPGVAYFEMVRAALMESDESRTLAFQEVVFVAPLRVEEGESREVFLKLIPHSNTNYQFAIQSVTPDPISGIDTLKDYTVGRVNLTETPVTKYDVEDIRQRCNRRELLLAAEEREEDLGPRWHSVQRVFIGENEVLLELQLPEAFHRDFDQMKFHPALLDRAAGIAKNFLANEGHYLPFTYKDLKIKGALPPNIYSYARYRDDDPSKETITFDITLMDESGYGLVEIEGFTQIRRNDPGEEIRALSQTDSIPVTKEPTMNRFEEIRPAEGVEALARILSARVGPQIVVSVRDLNASIVHSAEVLQRRISDVEGPSVKASSSKSLVHPRPPLNTPYVEPSSELEIQIASLWQEMIGIDRVGIHDNFFDLGADSLTGIQIVSRLEKELNLKIPPVAIFEGGTVQKLAEMLSNSSEDEAPQAQAQDRGARRRQNVRQRRNRDKSA